MAAMQRLHRSQSDSRISPPDRRAAKSGSRIVALQGKNAAHVDHRQVHRFPDAARPLQQEQRPVAIARHEEVSEQPQGQAGER